MNAHRAAVTLATAGMIFLSADSPRAQAESRGALGGPGTFESYGECPPMLIPWQRSAEVRLCGQRCRSDTECGSDERCVVLDDPSGEAVFADDVPDRFLEAAALIEESTSRPIVAEAPTCEGECGGYTGDLVIRPQLPLALCDPYASNPDALLAEDDVAAVAASADEVAEADQAQ